MSTGSTGSDGAGGRVLVGGEVLVDLVPEHGEAGDSPRPLVPSLGGGPFNAAVALGRLGVRTSMLTRASTDPSGNALVGRLAANGVGGTAVQRGAEPTSLAVVTLAEDGSARYSFYVKGTADRLVADPGGFPDDVAAVALGGLSLLLELKATVYGTLLERAAAAGCLVSLDPKHPDRAAHRPGRPPGAAGFVAPVRRDPQTLRRGRGLVGHRSPEVPGCGRGRGGPHPGW